MPSFFKKTMVYLGLVDDDFDSDDYYADTPEPAPRGSTRTNRTGGAEPMTRSARFERVMRPEQATSVFDEEPRSHVAPMGAGPRSRPTSSGEVPRQANVRPIGPMGPSDAVRVHVVTPEQFGDAKEIADCLKGNRPVIVNLQIADRDLKRRMIDFCSGVTYALSGEMEKVADDVFLLSPINVKISDEDRQRLQSRAFDR